MIENVSEIKRIVRFCREMNNGESLEGSKVMPRLMALVMVIVMPIVKANCRTLLRLKLEDRFI